MSARQVHLSAIHRPHQQQKKPILAIIPLRKRFAFFALDTTVQQEKENAGYASSKSPNMAQNRVQKVRPRTKQKHLHKEEAWYEAELRMP